MKKEKEQASPEKGGSISVGKLETSVQRSTTGMPHPTYSQSLQLNTSPPPESGLDKDLHQRRWNPAEVTGNQGLRGQKATLQTPPERCGGGVGVGLVTVRETDNPDKDKTHRAGNNQDVGASGTGGLLCWIWVFALQIGNGAVGKPILHSAN